MDNIFQQITDDAKKRGYDVRIRDIAYALLRAKFGDALISFTVVFGTPESDNAVTCYDEMDSVRYLVRYFIQDLAPKPEEKSAAEIVRELKKRENEGMTAENMSFEENRAGIETQIKEIVQLKIECPRDDIKTLALLQKTEADLRSKLNDKFGASEKSESQYIFPTRRFDMICPWTRRECYQMTKEDAMKHWKLIEKE